VFTPSSTGTFLIPFGILSSVLVGVPALAFVATVVSLVAGGVLVGEPVTWDAAPGVVRNGMTATGIAGGFQWLVGRGE